MPHDPARHDAPGRDEARQGAIGVDYEYTLTIEDVADRYAKAGYPRTLRTLQRYCVSGHLDARRVATALGDKFFVAPYSVARHLGQIEEMAAFATAATIRDAPRHDATPAAVQNTSDTTATQAPASSDQPRHDATSRVTSGSDTPPFEDRYVRQLERENEFLRDQVMRKDGQIGELTERAKETNFLIQGLQHLVLRLQPGRSEPSVRDHPATPPTEPHSTAASPDTMQ